MYHRDYRRNDAREEIEPTPDRHHSHVLLEPLNKLARAFGDEGLVFPDRGCGHAAVPGLAPPEVRLCVLDPDNWNILAIKHAPNEI